MNTQTKQNNMQTNKDYYGVKFPPIKQEQPHPEYNKKICAIAVSEVLSHEQKLKEIDLLIAEYYPIRQDADNPAWEEVDKGFDKLEGFKHDKPTEQEVKAVGDGFEKGYKVALSEVLEKIKPYRDRNFDLSYVYHIDKKTLSKIFTPDEIYRLTNKYTEDDTDKEVL